MKSRRNIVFGTIALAAFVFWISGLPDKFAPAPSKPNESRAVAPSPPPPGAESPGSAAVPPTPAIAPPTTAPSPRPAASGPATVRDLADPLIASDPPGMPPPRRAATVNPEVAADFDKIALMLRDYRTLTGENPVGTNAEIMAAIIGGNPKGAKLGPPEGQTLNANGELIDRWGTPYFFHQLTKDRMEIRSAGPDRRMWNGDDLTGD